MARPRKATTIAGARIDLAGAPGLEVRRHRDTVYFYWVARKDARARGYTPKLVRLHGALDDIKARARQLQQEMAVWLADPRVTDKAVYDRTVTSLIGCYQTDPDSPYRNVKQNTRRGYDDWCKVLVREYGSRRIDKMQGTDLRRWFNEIAAPKAPGEAPRIVLASRCVRTMMMILLNYGVETGLEGCIELVQALERMTLRVPDHLLAEWHLSRPVRQVMTFEHASAIVTKGLSLGTVRGRSIALGVAAQFEFTIAQVDVIGAWEKIERVETVRRGEIVCRDQVWRPGLCYEDFLPGMTLDLTRSKNEGRAIFDVREYPLFLRALAAVPEAERHGPAIIDNAGLPFRKREYQRTFRTIADAAGVPSSVLNMLARHGGATEADQAGVSLSDTSQHLQHADIQTTKRHYVKPTVEVTRRVQRARVGSRKETA